MIEFLASLGPFGVFVVAVLALCLLNLRKLIRLRTPLDSTQHRLWKWSGGIGKPDHLEAMEDDKRPPPSP